MKVNIEKHQYSMYIEKNCVPECTFPIMNVCKSEENATIIFMVTFDLKTRYMEVHRGRFRLFNGKYISKLIVLGFDRGTSF